jgi:hypothetical protein
MSNLYRMALDILWELEQNGKLNRDIYSSPRDETLEPQPPKPFFVQEYSLAVETNLIGRDGELRALDSWLYDSTSPHFGARIYCIDAAGGMGKSALVRNWLDRLLSRPTPHFEAVVWFSFYAVETGFDVMAESVLPYLLRLPGLDHIRDADLSSLEKMLRIVEERRILLVLDGLERRMKLYTTFRARGYEGRDLTELVKERVEYHRHLFLSDWPDEAARQLAEEDCYRTTEEESEVLRRLAQPGRSRVLITSRFFPTDLQHRQTKPSDTKNLPDAQDLEGVTRLTLEPFDLPKARELAVALDLPWQPEFSALHGKVGGYPLYLALAFAFAARGKDSPEGFRRRVAKIASALKGDAEEARKAVVTLGIDDLSYEQQEILYEVEFCPIATNFVGLRRVLCGPASLFERPSELEANLQVLHARKLLGWDRQTGTCDMHPVVRHAVRHFGDQPAINQRIIDRHGGDSQEALHASNVAMLNERQSETLLLFNAIMRKESYSEKSFLAYLLLDDWFRFNSSQIDKRLENLEYFHQYEFKYTVPARIQLLTRLADTYQLKAQLDVAHRHAVRAFQIASDSGDQNLIQMACLRCSQIAYSQSRCLDQDRFLRTAAQHDLFSSTDSHSIWLLCSQVAASAAALRKEEASQILSYLRFYFPSSADVIYAEFELATALWPIDDQQKSNLEEILARFRRRCLYQNLVYGRFASVVMSAELALLFGETPEYKNLIDNALSDVELTRFTALRLELTGKRARLATRRGFPKSALDEGRRARNDALQRGLSYIEAEACLAIAEAHFALNEREPAIHFATEAANIANADGEPYCLRLLKNQIQKFFIKDLREPAPEFRPYPANQLTELPPMPPIPEPFSTVVCISDTNGWSDEKLERRYRVVLHFIDWANTTGSARKWWEFYENANPKASVLKLAEQLAISKATITEFFLAYVYSNTEDTQANLDYMYYSRLKKSEEARKKAKQKGEPLPPSAFTPPQADCSSKGISDSSDWTEEAVRRRLAEVKESLAFPASAVAALNVAALKWWDAFEKENTHRISVVLRLAEELLIRKATLEEFYLACVYSNTDNILANLYYLDYTRGKKHEAQKKKQKEAAARLKALLPDLATGHKLPELTEKDLSILANLSDEDIPEGVRERLSELIRTTRDRIRFQKEQE